jgi:hypothetical protein
MSQCDRLANLLCYSIELSLLRTKYRLRRRKTEHPRAGNKLRRNQA